MKGSGNGKSTKSRHVCLVATGGDISGRTGRMCGKLPYHLWSRHGPSLDEPAVCGKRGPAMNPIPPKQRDLRYWKERKIQIREAVVELVAAYRFASRKEAEAEQLIFNRKRG